MSLKQQIKDDMKTAMRAKAKERLAVIRLILADIQRKEVDDRTELDDSGILTVLNKMVKQRKDSIQQFTQAERQDLADKEESELETIQTYLPKPLSDAEVEAILAEALEKTGAQSPQDMGKVMGWLKPKVQGRTDMGKLSGLIKAHLST